MSLWQFCQWNLCISGADVREDADGTRSSVNIPAVQREAERGGEKLWQLYKGLCAALKSLSFRLFPYPWICPACPVGEAELWAGLSRVQTQQGRSSPLLSLPQGEQSQPVALVGQAGRAGRLGMSLLFASTQGWGILSECFSFCPDFLWNPGFPVHEKF